MYSNRVLAISIIVIVVFFGAAFFCLQQLFELSREPRDSIVTTPVASTSVREEVVRSQEYIPVTSDVKFNVRFETDANSAVWPLDSRYKASSAMAAKFRSLSPGKISIWYDDGEGGVDQGHLAMGQETTTNTYEGHVFFFTEYGRKNKELARFTMSPERALYLIEDPKRPAPDALVQASKAEEQFMEEYFARTGLLWRHYYGPDGPRPPPSLFMWPAERVGDVHSATSRVGQWLCRGSAAECQSTEPVTMELEVISTAPRAFLIPNFLSDFETEEIIRLARPHMAHSIVGDVDSGAFESNTRTSRNTWVKRGTNDISESLFLRAADLLRVDEKLLTRQRNAEDIQVVHYVHGQKYDSHHDWGVSGYIESRYITLLLYLTDMESATAGGETAFPKADEGRGIKVHAGKGGAVLFYNLLEDGNGDDLALHAALPCVQGEKWLANFWVWDPKFKDA